MLAERALAPLTDVFLFESAYIADRFDALVGAHNGVRRVVANGISPAEFTPAIPNADAADLLYVGELRAAKGIDTLLEAVARVGRARGLVPRTVLVGSGPDQAALTELARRLGDRAVRLLPRTDAGARSLQARPRSGRSLARRVDAVYRARGGRSAGADDRHQRRRHP